MLEEREDFEDIEEEYEDLDDLESVPLKMEEFSDLAGLEEIPEDQEAGLSEGDVVITYGEKIEDEIEILERRYNETIDRLQKEDTETALRELSSLLNDSKMLDAHHITAKTASYIGKLLSSQGNHKDATEFYLLSVSEARKSGDKKLHLENLTPFGLNLLEFDPKDASVVFGQAVKLADELGDKEAYALNTLHFANCLSLEDSAQALRLYNEAKKYFETIENVEWVGIINYKIGKIYLDTKDYHQAYHYLVNSNKQLNSFPETKQSLELYEAIIASRELKLSGTSVRYRLKLPAPEIADQTPNVRKIFQLLSTTGSFDIIKGLRNIKYVQEPSESSAFDGLKCIFEDSNCLKMADDDLLREADIYEEIGDLYLKDKCSANSFYNYVAAQTLFVTIGNSKKQERLEKKLDKLIQSFSIAEDTNIISNLQIYLNYQIGRCTYERKPKDSKKYAEKSIELARKRNNPLYEALNKEILADIKKSKDIEKAAIDYHSIITIYEELEDKVDLLRIFEKYGLMMLPHHNDRGKEILSKALTIAQELKKEEVINRIQEKL